MASRGRRGRGRPPKTSLSVPRCDRSKLSLRKPKYLTEGKYSPKPTSEVVPDDDHANRNDRSENDNIDISSFSRENDFQGSSHPKFYFDKAKETSISLRSDHDDDRSSFGGDDIMTEKRSNENSRCSTPMSQVSSSGIRKSSARIMSRKGRGLIKDMKQTLGPAKLMPRSYPKLTDNTPDYGDGIMYESDADESDSADSIGGLSFSDVESEVSDNFENMENDIEGLVPAKKRWVQPRPATPVFYEREEVPALELPESCTDLLIQNQDLMKAMGIYEILRHFWTIVRLSPFRFEDFLAALYVDEQSILLNEIHISLTKSIIREEDSAGSQFGPGDVKDSINIIFYSIDNLTWPAVVKKYLESENSRDFRVGLPTLNKPDYASLELNDRLNLLSCLTDLFLSTQKVRAEIISEGTPRYDDHCRVCYKLGDLLCCDACTAVYHLACVSPPLEDVPEDDWICQVCKANQTKGVTDCMSEAEKSGILSRQEPLGYDRYQRKYWFLCRRIFVEDEDKLFYYSTKEHLNELIECLDREYWERDLVLTFEALREDIEKHMQSTLELTKESKSGKEATLLIEIENSIKRKEAKNNKESEERSENATTALIKDLEEKIDKESKSEENDKAGSPKEDNDSTNKFGERRKIVTRSSTGSTAPRQFTDSVVEGLKKVNKTSNAFSDEKIFKLGMECSYKKYENQYTSQSLALNKHQHNEERDKKRWLSHKFSLSQDFKWNGSVCGNTEITITTLQNTLTQLENQLLVVFLHPNWVIHRQNWVKAVGMCKNPTDFALALAILEACIKPVLFNPVWNDSLGQLRLKRVTLAEKEELKKKDKRSHRTNDDDDVYRPMYAKFTLGLRHQVWKQKGEEYRTVGTGGWLWHSSTRQQVNLSQDEVGLRAIGHKLRIRLGKLEEMQRAQQLYSSDKKPRLESADNIKTEIKEELDVDKADVNNRVSNLESPLANSIEDIKKDDASDVSRSSGEIIDIPTTKVAEIKEEIKADVKQEVEEECVEKENEKMDIKDDSVIENVKVEDANEDAEIKSDDVKISRGRVGTAIPSSAMPVDEDLINVSEGLLNRTCYPKLSTKPYSKLDCLLERRSKQLELEKKQKNALAAIIKKFREQELKKQQVKQESGIDVVNVTPTKLSENSAKIAPDNHPVQPCDSEDNEPRPNDDSKSKLSIADDARINQPVAAGKPSCAEINENMDNSNSSSVENSSDIVSNVDAPKVCPEKRCNADIVQDAVFPGIMTSNDEVTNQKIDNRSKDSKDQDKMNADNSDDCAMGNMEASAMIKVQPTNKVFMKSSGDGQSGAENSENVDAGSNIVYACSDGVPYSPSGALENEATCSNSTNEKLNINTNHQGELNVPLSEEESNKLEAVQAVSKSKIVEQASLVEQIEDISKSNVMAEDKVEQLHESLEEANKSLTVIPTCEAEPVDEGATKSKPVDEGAAKSEPVDEGAAKSELVDEGAAKSELVDEGAAKSELVDEGAAKSELVDKGHASVSSDPVSCTTGLKMVSDSVASDALKKDGAGAGAASKSVGILKRSLEYNDDSGTDSCSSDDTKDKAIKTEDSATSENSDKNSIKLPKRPVVNTASTILAATGTAIGACLTDYIHGGRLQLNSVAIEELEKKMKEIGDPRVKVSLVKSQRGIRSLKASLGKAGGKKNSLPVCQKFLTKSRQRSLLILEKVFLKKLARCGGKIETPGFSSSAKTNQQAWPYPCPRPLFKTVWRYNTQCLNTLASAALQMRILISCVRWDDLSIKALSSGHNTITTESDITTTELLKRRDVGPYHLRSEYLVRKIVVPLGVPTPQRDSSYTPQRSGLRKRRQPETPKQKEPSIVEKWVQEEKLDLWEIKNFAEKIERKKQEEKEDGDKNLSQGVAAVKSEGTPNVQEAQLQQQRIIMQQKRLSTEGGKVVVSASPVGSTSLYKTILPGSRLSLTTQPSKVHLVQGGNITISKDTPIRPQSVTKTLLTGDGSRLRGATKVQLIRQPIKVGAGQPQARSIAPNSAGSVSIRPGGAGALQVQPQATQSNVQNLRIIQNPNGQISVQGLLPGQQLVKLPDGRLQLISLPQTKVVQKGTTLTVLRTNNASAGAVPTIAASKPQGTTVNTSPAVSASNSTPKEIPKTSKPRPSIRRVAPSSTKYSITPQMVQQVVKQAMLQNQDPNIRDKLMAMQKGIDSGKISLPTAAKMAREVSKSGGESMAIMNQISNPQVQKKVEKTPSKITPQSEEKKKRAAINRLNASLEKHKENLKKEIQRKRSLMERQLQQDIRSEVNDYVNEQKISRKRSITPPPPSYNDSDASKKKKLKMVSTGKMTNKKLCICKTPYDESRFYVGCDLCSNWFHGSCVGISENKAKRLDSFVCDDCKDQNGSEELYCICRTPYDESKFYIGCDNCQDWFHGRCVGVNKEEADHMDTYTCPTCKLTGEDTNEPKNLTEDHRKEMKKLTKALRSHKMAWPFQSAVDPNEVADYYNIIKDPMDLSTLEGKVSNNGYCTLNDYIKDVTKVFDNCRYYNAKGSAYFKCADVLEAFFVVKLKTLKEKWEKS